MFVSYRSVAGGGPSKQFVEAVDIRTGDRLYKEGKPIHYSPMQQEGSIVLGTGGDNSNWSVGSFFEGVMTSGVPSDAADDAVQANIVSAGYGDSTGQTGQLIPGSEISIRATTPCCTNFYIRHQFNAAIISPISPSSSSLDKNDATWIVRTEVRIRVDVILI